MRMFRLVGGLLLAAGAAQAQLAVTQPTERLLVLPLGVTTAADSSVSIQVMDAARERLLALARYKAVIITKAKLCEALEASGFQCNGLLDEQQAAQLARFLSAHAYTAGLLSKNGSTWTARLRVVDIASSGFASSFTVTNGNPGTPAALAEAIAQRIFVVIRAGEFARQCNTERGRSSFVKAIQAAQKAFALDSNATTAHLCILNTYEAQRFPADSIIRAARRGLSGDSLWVTGWERLASALTQKGDTIGAIDAYKGRLRASPRSIPYRLSLAQLLFQRKQYQEAADLLGEGTAMFSTDAGLHELRRRVCIEGSLWKCALEELTYQAEGDTAVLGDSTWYKSALGAAQQVSDTAALLRFSALATTRFPRSASFWKARGSAYADAGKADSAVWAYRQAVAIDPSDIASSLLIAKAIVDGAVWDTGSVKPTCGGDTACVARLRNAFADRFDSAKVFIDRGLAAPDSALRLNAAVIMLTAGSKLAQAQAYARAYPWLDQTLQIVAPRTPADTVGPRQQIRVQTSFWFGVASTLSLGGPYGDMVKTGNAKDTPQARKCGDARAIFDRIVRSKEALIRGGRVAPGFANQMMGILSRYEDQMPRVRQAFKCTNF